MNDMLLPSLEWSHIIPQELIKQVSHELLKLLPQTQIAKDSTETIHQLRFYSSNSLKI